MEVIGFRETSPASIILQHLQRHGQATIKELEEVLGISTTAVREHLCQLYAHGLVTATSVRGGPGRPRLVYTLTDKAQILFPKQYDLLINMILQEIAAAEGIEKVERLLTRVSARLAREYTDRISGEDIEARLDELRAMLESKGLAVEVQPSGEGLTIYSCPYFGVAQHNDAVCTMEQHMIEQVIGTEIRLEHSIRNGHHNCCFTVNPHAG